MITVNEYRHVTLNTEEKTTELHWLTLLMICTNNMKCINYNVESNDQVWCTLVWKTALTHWRPIPIHYRDRSFLHCRPIPIVYLDQFYIFFLFRNIPDTVSGLGFSVCYLLLSFHSIFRSGGVHSFYFTKLLRNPTQLDKLLLTISKWQRTLLKVEAKCRRISVQI